MTFDTEQLQPGTQPSGTADAGKPLNPALAATKANGGTVLEAASLCTVEWRAVPGAMRYRVTERDLRTGKARRIYNGPQTSIVLGATADRAYRVEVLIESEPDFRTIVPFFTIDDRSAANPLRIAAPDGEGMTAWRLVVVDRDTEQRVFDRIAPDPAFALDCAALSGAGLRYRLLCWRWREARWDPIGAYQPLQENAGAPAIRPAPAVSAPAPPRAKPAGSGLAVMFTIDTEASLRLMQTPDRDQAIDHQVFGRDGEREVGIGLIMDQLGRRGIRGTFFLDILAELQFGREPMQRAIEAIQSRGHDIQLHLHPSPHLAYAKDDRLFEICLDLKKQAAPEAFKRALDIAVELFIKRVGHEPVAFRNGSYHIEDSYFDILRAAGIRYDSTVYAFKNCKASPWIRGRTQPFEVVSGLWEVPVSWILSKPRDEGRFAVSQFSARKGSALKIVEQSFAALAEVPGNPSCVVTMLHSYTYLNEVRASEPRAWDAWNRQFERLVPAPTYPYLRRSAGAVCTYRAGVDDERIASVEHQLDALSRIPAIRMLAFDELQAGDLPWQHRPAHGFEPLVEFDYGAGKSRVTALRRYNSDFLKCIDKRAAPAG
ncbi:MAG: hypothetical protein JO305_06970 [Alphaproteobacteria bacterium]|nr:hypothetical protein [Alphaproteobacteria bacterium]